MLSPFPILPATSSMSCGSAACIFVVLFVLFPFFLFLFRLCTRSCHIFTLFSLVMSYHEHSLCLILLPSRHAPPALWIPSCAFHFLFALFLSPRCFEPTSAVHCFRYPLVHPFDYFLSLLVLCTVHLFPLSVVPPIGLILIPCSAPLPCRCSFP